MTEHEVGEMIGKLIGSLAAKAEGTTVPDHALKWSQSALNVAHAGHVMVDILKTVRERSVP
jgi:hypothetical protein